MFGQLGAPELLIILVIVIAIFGVGKLAGIGGALGSSVKEFRSAVRDDDKPRATDRANTPDSVQVYDQNDDTTGSTRA